MNIGPAGFMQAPAEEPTPRYVVRKASGSHLARVVDTKTGEVIQKYNVLKHGHWERADEHARRLNAITPSLAL
jgi:hypothetical protein